MSLVPLLKILVLLGLAVFASLFILACSSTRPERSLTLTALLPCPDSPNCVSSQAAAGSKAVVAPLAATLDEVKAVVEDMPRTTVVEERPGYLWVEYTIPVIPFVDDVEFMERPDGQIDVRSASRVGYSDLGVNRRRVEAIRTRLAQ